MTIEAAILNLQAKWLSIDGVNSAPDYPPESPGAYPFAVTYERRGRLAGRSFGFGDEIALLFSELHVARTMLPRDIQAVMPFRDQFIALLIADPTLGGTVSTITPEGVSWTFGRLGWGQESTSQEPNTIGYRFEIEVKVPQRLTP